MSQRFPRRRRLTRGAELDVVRREGKRVRTEHLEVRVLASLRAFPRLGDAGRVGLVVPKHRHSSVERNLLKRRLRELIRLRLLPLVAGLPPVALVVRAHPTAYGATFEALARQVERLRRDVARLAAPPAATPPAATPPAATPPAATPSAAAPPAPDPARDPAPDVP